MNLLGRPLRVSTQSGILMALFVMSACTGCGSDGAPGYLSVKLDTVKEQIHDRLFPSKNPVVVRVEDLEVRRSDVPLYFPNAAANLTTSAEGRKQIMTYLTAYASQAYLGRQLTNTEPYASQWKRAQQAELAVLYRQYVLAKYPVTDGEMDTYYRKHTTEFTAHYSLASHVVLKDPAQAAAVFSLYKKGQSFSTLAKKYSIDKASGREGGTMNPVEDSRSPVGVALKDIPVGVVVTVTTTAGTELIKKTGDLNKPKPWEEVAPVVRNVLEYQRVLELIQKEKGTLHVENHDEALIGS